MDFHSMKRKRLQSLCKKHGIPANLKNMEMANRLSLLLKGKEYVVPCSSENAGPEKEVVNMQTGETVVLDRVTGNIYKDVVNVETGELKSSIVNNLQMVASDTVAGNVDVLGENFVTSIKWSASPNLEERIGLSPKLLKNSETERLEPEVNLSPEKTKDDTGMCDNNLQMVASDTAAGNADVLEENFVTSIKRSASPNLEERIGFSPKLLKNSETERLEPEMTLSPEKTRDDAVMCDLERNMQSGGNKGQLDVDGSQEGLHPAPGVVVKKDVDIVHGASEESCNYLEEAEVEKLGDNTDIHEDICGSGKGEAEDEKQAENNPQGSNANDFNVLQISPEESGYSFVEKEVHKSDENISVHGGVYYIRNGKSEADTMCLEPLMGAKDTVGKVNVIAEHSLDKVHLSSHKGSDGTPVQSLPNPLSEVKSSDLNIHQMVVSGTAIGNAEACEVNFASSQKLSLSPADSEKIGFSPKLLNNSTAVELESEMNLSPETSRDDIGICDMEENVQSDVNLIHVSSKESNYPLVEGEIQKSDDTICVHGGVYNFGDSGSEVDTMCLLDSSIATKDNDGKTNVTMEHFPEEEVYSSSCKHSDGTPDQFLTTHPLIEVKSSDLNIPQMVASDTCEEKLKSSQRIGLVEDQEESIGFYTKHLGASDIKGFEAETNIEPSTLGDIVGTCNMKENIQSVKTGHCNEAETFFNSNTVGDILGTHNMEESQQSVKNEIADYSQEVLHTTMNAVVTNEMGLLHRPMEECNSVQGEVTRLFEHTDAHDEAGGTGAEDENQLYMVSLEREKRDMDSLGEYFPNEFQSADNASGQNSEVVPTMPQAGETENKSCTFSIDQMLASDTASGDEDAYQKQLESPPKCTPIASSEGSISFSSKLLESSTMKKEMEIEMNLPLKTARHTFGTSDMKENINVTKKEQVGTVTSKKTFPKRLPLQDLKQK